MITVSRRLNEDWLRRGLIPLLIDGRLKCWSHQGIWYRIPADQLENAETFALKRYLARIR